MQGKWRVQQAAGTTSTASLSQTAACLKEGDPTQGSEGGGCVVGGG